jgi:DNA-3-methyladenine glycosylase
MFGPGGNAYVYLIYGIHHCFNVVTGPEGEGSAVLIRALIPLQGLSFMRQRRGGRVPDEKLCDGPGKICRALELDLSWNGHPLSDPPLQILWDGTAIPEEEIFVTPRIGITKNTDQLRRYLWVL